MSNIPTLLKKTVEIEKTAQYEFIKDYTASTMAHLMKAGVAHEKAASIAREACLQNANLADIVKRAALLEKTAEYIEYLEKQVSEMGTSIEKKAEAATVEVPEHLQKLASLGFSQEEISALSGVSDDLVEKVASAVSEPWSLGKAAGVSGMPSDPLLDFCLS